MNTQNIFKILKVYLAPQRLLWVTISLLLILNCSCSGKGSAAAAPPWPTSTPEKQGMDSVQLINFLDVIKKGKYNLHNIIVLRHDHLVMEVYYPPFTPQDKHMLYSATKSIISALVGIAVKEGKIQNIDQPMLDYFPHTHIANMSDQKKNIHLHDLLNMTSGLTNDELEMSKCLDWAQYTLDQPMNNEPGTTFDYDNGNPMLLSAILQKATGKSALEYASGMLFAPLGIQDVFWPSDPSGATDGETGLMLTPRDMAKLGALYLHKGRWNHAQIIPSEWVEASTQANTNKYAFQWWQRENGFYASGLGEQYIYVIPSKDMVVVTTAKNFSSPTIMDLIDNFIIKAAQSDQPLPESPASKELADRIAAVSNPETKPVPPLPAIAGSLKGKTLYLDENPIKWQTAKLDFDNSQAWLTVTTPVAPQGQTFAIGLDGIYRRNDVKGVKTPSIPNLAQRTIYNPYEFNFILGVPTNGSVAMKGLWLSDSSFLLTVQDTRDMDRDMIVFVYAPNHDMVYWVSDGVGFGSHRWIITGKLE